MRLFDDNIYWVEVRDGNLIALKLYEKHYSCYKYKDGRKRTRFVGPGERIVLIGKNNDALFIWRKFRSMDNQEGIDCACFRNESNILSSELLNQAEAIAHMKWPNERFYTYVDVDEIKSVNPGYCYKMNGWRQIGITKTRKLIILEKLCINAN